MAIKASASVTLSSYRDTEAITRHYKLVSSTASAPSKPTENPPSDWDDTEPSYTSGSTNTLYFCDLTEFSDGTWAYSAVSKSSSYEAAKEAYNKAQNAQDSVDNLEIGGRNLQLGSGDWNSTAWISKGDVVVSNDVASMSSNSYPKCSVISVDVGGTYTVSFDIKADVSEAVTPIYGIALLDFLNSEKNRVNYIWITGVLTSEWKRVCYTFVVPYFTDLEYLSFGLRNTNNIANVYYKHLKIELGNKATDWTPAPEDVDANIANEKPVINGTQTSNTYSWTGIAPFKELKDGQKITYWLPYSCSGSTVSMPYWSDSEGTTQQSTNSGAVLNLTLSDGSTTGNVACFYSGSSRLTSHFGQGNAIELTYKKLVKIGSYYYTGWWANANYYADTYDNRINYFAGKTGDKGIWSYSLFMEDGSGTYQNICTASDGTVTTSNRTTAKTKIANTNGFKIGSSIYYTNTSYNANSNISGSGVVYSSVGSRFDSRYSFNTELVANSLTPYKPIYLVGTIGSDNLFYLDEVWWTQTPTTEGKVYVLVGACYDSTTSYCRITLYENNRWYVYDGEKLQDYNVETMTPKANIISCINQTPESITIQAEKISLEGLITANGGFKVLEDGSVETINGKFSGAINIYNNSDLIGTWDSNGFVINKYFKAGSDISLDSFFEIDSSENISKVYIGKKRVGYCNEYGVYIDPDNEAYVENDGRFQFFTEYDEDYGRTVNGLLFGNSMWICSKVDSDYPYKFIIDDLQAKQAYIDDLYVNGISIKPTTGSNRYIFPGGLKACWGSVTVTYANSCVLSKTVSFPFTFTNAPFVTAFITNTNNSYADLDFNLKTGGVAKSSFVLYLHSRNNNFDSSSAKVCNWFAIGY